MRTLAVLDMVAADAAIRTAHAVMPMERMSAAQSVLVRCAYEEQQPWEWHA